jgi:YtcA family
MSHDTRCPVRRSSAFDSFDTSSLDSLQICRGEASPIRTLKLSLQTHLLSRSSEGDNHDVAFGLDAIRTGRRALTPIFLTSVALGGCATRGAPSYPIVGAFFPGWMFCALIGIVGALATRGLFVATKLNRVLPFQLFVCASMGVIIAAAAWILWFGR